jgi:hypothetical protein
VSTEQRENLDAVLRQSAFPVGSTVSVVYERYRDSEAVIEHGAHVGHLNEAIFATGSVSSELLGEPSAELTAMIAGSGVPLLRPFLSR